MDLARVGHRRYLRGIQLRQTGDSRGAAKENDRLRRLEL